jgi:uncharacterized protein with NRDE domain
MCLIAFGWNPTPQLRLLVAANRDEFHGRSTAAMTVWADAPAIIAGRDLEAHGTWLGVSTRGRLAAVTNVRLPGMPASGLRSRGSLTLDFLKGEQTPGQHLSALQASFSNYGPCNLLLADATQAFYASNHPGVPAQHLQDGLYGLSNAALDTPWPKTVALKKAVHDSLQDTGIPEPDALLLALADDHTPPDSALPDTGVGLMRERYVAPAFIRGREYGTRCSTIITVDRQGKGLVLERRFGPDGVLLGDTRIAFQWP